ncbi:hypothetical protein C0991_005275 [Blastosporella zonata]|nr:hypothetical protein C0991_005275 [Blastosporella zonata]
MNFLCRESLGWRRRIQFPKPFYHQTRLVRTSRRPGIQIKEARSPLSQPWITYPASIILLASAGWIAYDNSQPVRHVVLAVVRCSRLGVAAALGAVDYKATFARSYPTDAEYTQAVSECHTRSAQRVLRALLANGGVFIKIGQHMASLYVLPVEWTSTMRPLQDRCEPTAYDAVDALFRTDIGQPITEVFDEFDPNPIGVASLAQVHIARLRETGEEVAVKLQHPHLAEFCEIDMKMVEATLGWIKYWFPEFEFTWLGEEMRTNLPKEMNFILEAHNSERTIDDFKSIDTSLYIPKVITATKKVLIMEYIEGGRVDDLKYLADAHIDRNKVALELSRIFNQMVFVNGWFHADPHPGNLLIRPAPKTSRSPYNFEIVLLDHGLYFDLDPALRANYAKLWLSLIAPASPETTLDRRKYAELVGNIGPDLYPVFEAALTGRAALEGTVRDNEDDGSFHRATSMIDMEPQSNAELDAIRNAVVKTEGLLTSVFDVLRRVPRRILMVLKLNDLTRSLDHSLMTTHSNIRIFLIMAKYCTYAVWQIERKRLIDAMQHSGVFTYSLLRSYFSCWWKFEKAYTKLVILEMVMDFEAYTVITKAWVKGWWKRGFEGAHQAAAGLAY